MAFFSESTNWVLISFVIFAIGFWKFGLKLLLGKLDGRIEDIRKEIETAESLRVEAQELLAQYQRKQRDAAREGSALESLACWAGRFTPTLSLSPPAGLLLEIGGCLRLFGGVEVIVEAVLGGCAGQSYSTLWAVAPTPLGARWLAPWFARPRAWQLLDAAIGLTMFVLAALLLRHALAGP